MLLDDPALTEFGQALGAVLQVPGAGGLQGVVDVVDILHAGGFEPTAEGFLSLLGKDGDAVLPGGATAEHAVELGARLARELEGLDEDRVGDASGEVDERFVGHGFGIAEVLQGLGAGVGLLALEGLGAFDELHHDGNFDLEDIDVVARLAELGHCAGDDLGLLLGVGEGLFVAAVGVVADELQEEGNVMGQTFVTNPLDPCLLQVVEWDFSNGV